MQTFKPGDEIIVKVDGKDRKTVIDANGVQRFATDSLLVYLHKRFNIDLNRFKIDANGGVVSSEDHMRYTVETGVSVDGFCDLFPDAIVENPLW
ncbi:MAG: hypothetical protein JWN50_454 [Parcubacteria group bacterium]|nr:hypothetical protein [Parcubacteria group bacterium]